MRRKIINILLFITVFCALAGASAENGSIIDTDIFNKAVDFSCSKAIEAAEGEGEVETISYEFDGDKLYTFHVSVASKTWGRVVTQVPCTFEDMYSLSIGDITAQLYGSRRTYNPEGFLLNKLKESECREIALQYFNGLSWKNPSSVTIHNQKTVYSAHSFIFEIDYSAQNGFGGNNRETYHIDIDFNTGEILAAISL